MSVTTRRAFLKSSALAVIAARSFKRASATASPTTLYNGIELPAPWPPAYVLRSEPTAPSYLTHPPAVIPIDVGRQLFVDDFLVDRTNLRRTFHQPKYHAGNPVLRPDCAWEQRDESARTSGLSPNPAAMVFSDGVFFDPAARVFKMWYMGGYLESTCLATSTDGLHWTKPTFPVVPGTNIVHQGARDSSTVWLDLSDPDATRRYKMTVYRRPAVMSLASADGIKWREIGAPFAAGDRTTMFYNPFRRVWVDSIRAGGEVGRLPRHRLYREREQFASVQGSSTAPSTWIAADRLDPPRPEYRVAPELYNLDCVAYESVMLGLFTMWRGEAGDREKPNDVCVGFSRDGFHWDRPDRRPFLPVSEDPTAWNHANVQSAGGCCLVVDDALYFYVSGRTGRPRTSEPGVCTTGVAMLRRDGFASLAAADDLGGTLTTSVVTFSGEHVFVNADARDGEIQVEMLDADRRPVAPFAVEHSSTIRTDSTRHAIRWDTADGVRDLRQRPVRFRFHLRGRARLYSFWVSPSRAGTSRGFVAAGGPGFSSSTDA